MNWDWGLIARGARKLINLRAALRRKARASFALRTNYRLEICRAGETVPHTVREVGSNLFTNDGLDAIKDRLFNPATAQAGMWWIGIGTDATPEDPTDSALGNETSRAAGTYTDTGPASLTVEHTFPAGVGTAVACVECGLHDQLATPGGTLITHKTFAVANKTDDDTLKVTITITLSDV